MRSAIATSVLCLPQSKIIYLSFQSKPKASKRKNDFDDDDDDYKEEEIVKPPSSKKKKKSKHDDDYDDDDYDDEDVKVNMAFFTMDETLLRLIIFAMLLIRGNYLEVQAVVVVLDPILQKDFQRRFTLRWNLSILIG